MFALLFETARRPFVVKNLTHGTPGGGSVSLEVPWREGTRVRSARREDLIRLLAPTVHLPTFELLETNAAASQVNGHPKLGWSVSLELNVTPRTAERVVLPKHRVALQLQMTAAVPLDMNDISLIRLCQIRDFGRDLTSDLI